MLCFQVWFPIFFAYFPNFNHLKMWFKMSQCMFNFVHFKNRMLNFKIGLISLLKELICVFWALQICLIKELSWKILKKKTKLCGAFVDLVQKNG